MALTAVLRKFRAPAAVLTLSLFLGLFLLAASDAGAYHNPLPVKNATYQVDGDPDLPDPFTSGRPAEQELTWQKVVSIALTVVLDCGGLLL